MNEHEEESISNVFEKLQSILANGCGCSVGPKGKHCSAQFSEEVVRCNLNNVQELTHTELDLVILANFQAFTRREVIGEKRPRSRCDFMFQSKNICKPMFLHLYGISNSRFRRLKEHYEANGIYPRKHGNSKRLPWNTLPQSTIEDVKAFITNYAEENAITLPGRIPGYKSEDIRLLSSCESKANVWNEYTAMCGVSNKQGVAYSTFRKLWEEFHPNVVVAKPRTDLCQTCQDNTCKLQRAANLSDAEKSECVKTHQEHLNSAQAERDNYRDACKKAAEVLNERAEMASNDGNDACSWEGTMHYSFDYAQQVHIPSNPMQPGPIYFKTPRKCGIFGVMCEAKPQQVNFLIDEASATGKGANATISYLDYYLEHHGQGETEVHLHADNCAGQNKNNYFMWYLAWRVLTELHWSVVYSFLIAGHTKFAPDRCFGILKKAYKTTYVSSLYDLARMVDSSSSAGVNKSQLVGTHDGRVIVSVYDWAAFLEPYFRKIPSIKKFHHFRFSRDYPGMVFCKEFVSSQEQSFMLLKNRSEIPRPRAVPEIVRPCGLTDERRRYLYREIRPFCKPGTEDLVAPEP